MKPREIYTLCLRLAREHGVKGHGQFAAGRRILAERLQVAERSIEHWAYGRRHPRGPSKLMLQNESRNYLNRKGR